MSSNSDFKLHIFYGENIPNWLSKWYRDWYDKLPVTAGYFGNYPELIYLPFATSKRLSDEDILEIEYVMRKVHLWI